MKTSVDDLLRLHTAFWSRELARPIVNVDCSLVRRTKPVPSLGPGWDDREGLILTRDRVSPETLQLPPFVLDGEDPIHGDVAFNTWPPYFRVPWMPGIVGCDLVVSRNGQTVYPEPYAPANWYDLEDLGFAPRLEWLDTLLGFTHYVVDHWHPRRCVATTDLIARGPGDLFLHVLGTDRAYLSFYDHPEETKRLLDQLTDLYIRWGQTQLDIIPRFHGGYCNAYGIWSPGTTIRAQEDYAMNLSRAQFEEFLLPSVRKVAQAFTYEVFHTHSGFGELARWVLDVDELKCIEVYVDPTGPTLEESIPLWNRILEKKSLIVVSPVTERQLDMLVSRLSPGGLWLDVEIIDEDQDRNAASQWSRAEKEG